MSFHSTTPWLNPFSFLILFFPVDCFHCIVALFQARLFPLVTRHPRNGSMQCGQFFTRLHSVLSFGTESGFMFLVMALRFVALHS
jgi:hypothetical protein